MTEGYMDAVKDAICTAIAAADNSLDPEDTHVIPSSDENIWTLDPDNLPLVTVRIGPTVDQETAYGRQLGSEKKGLYVMMFFTAHIFDNRTEDDDAATDVMQLAEKIKNHLLKQDDSASGLVWYERIRLREARIKSGMVARVIMEGYVFVRRPIHT